MSLAPHHQRNQVIAEATEEESRQQVDHHDHAVHGDILVIGAGVDKLQAAGKADLHPHQPGQNQRQQAYRDGGAAILNGDDLVILAPDIFPDKCLGAVMMSCVLIGICHDLSLLYSDSEMK